MKDINIYKNGFEVKFYNPITHEREYIGRYETEKEAISHYILYETNFYLENPILLPKAINVVKDKGFSLSTSIKHYSKHKTIHLGFYKTLEEARQGKLEFISKLID